MIKAVCSSICCFLSPIVRSSAVVRSDEGGEAFALLFLAISVYALGNKFPLLPSSFLPLSSSLH